MDALDESESVLTELEHVHADGALEAPATAKDFLVVHLEGKRRLRRMMNMLAGPAA